MRTTYDCRSKEVCCDLSVAKKPQREQFHLIEHGHKKIHVRNSIAARWNEFAIFLRLYEGNSLDALFDQCFRDPFRMADKLFELYIGNKRVLDPPVPPSWNEILDALKKMREMELVKNLQEYFFSEAIRLVEAELSTNPGQLAPEKQS